jgi:hypothetical protein
VEERGFSLDYSTSYGKIKYSKALSIVMCRYVHKSNYAKRAKTRYSCLCCCNFLLQFLLYL